MKIDVAEKDFPHPPKAERRADQWESLKAAALTYAQHGERLCAHCVLCLSCVARATARHNREGACGGLGVGCVEGGGRFWALSSPPHPRYREGAFFGYFGESRYGQDNVVRHLRVASWCILSIHTARAR